MAFPPPNKEDIPKFWYLLSDNDKKEYFSLYAMIKQSIPDSKTKKNRINSFNDTIELIRKYAVRGDQSDTARSIICGIIWLDDSIAINSHRLGFLMSKCKSSINGSLQMLGYKELSSKKQTSEIIRTKLFTVTNDRNEVRKWTIRRIFDKAQNVPDEILANQIMNPKDSNNEAHFNIQPSNITDTPINTETVIDQSTKTMYLVSTSPIESISQTEKCNLIKEDIIWNHVFQSINNNTDPSACELPQRDLGIADVFFY